MQEKSHHLETQKMHEQAKVDKQKHGQSMEHMTAAHKQKMAATKTAAGKPKATK